MATELRIISSMATRPLLADLAQAWQAAAATPRLVVESVGGVDAARRVQAGEAFDIVVLARGAIDTLDASGHLVPGSSVDLVRSGVGVAVAAGAAVPDIGTEQALRAAVLAAASIGYSTGPSGTQLLRLFERWGIASTVASRLRQAPPGVPVGSLVARGDVALGFQQMSELAGLDGITLVGPLPAAVQITTVFSAAIAATSRERESAAAVLAWMVSPAVDALVARHGMEKAR